MKPKILILLLFYFVNSYSQKIERKIGDFRITRESFFVEGKKKISKSDFYFDKSGKILEKIGFGRHHYHKLNIIGEIEQYFYSDNKLLLSKRYVSSCRNCSFSLYLSKYNYDDDKLIHKNVYRGESDSLFMSFDYKYKPNAEEIHSNSSTYIENKYDDKNRIIKQSQIFEDTKKVRWEKKFVYAITFQVNKFQTYYGDGDENTKMEIIQYDSQKRITSKEVLREKSKTFFYYYYAQNGIIKKIEESESYNDKYELKYITNFKIKKREKSIDSLTVDKINSQLIYETST
ncbi:hypothetical protein [Flavobacterium microcysteis]